MRNRASFSLIEIMIAVLIMAILVGLGVVNQGKAVERARLKQASIILKMVHDAERAYQLRNNSLIACVSPSDCFSKLDINSPIDLEESAWLLGVSIAAPAYAIIVRKNGTYGGCMYSIYLNANDTVWHSGGTCP